MKWLYPLLFGWLGWGSCLAQTITWPGHTDELPIANRLSVLEDATGKLTFAEVSSASYQTRFKPSEQRILNFGFTESYYWLRFTVANPTTDKLFLEIAHASLPVADLYYQNQQGQEVQLRAGYTVPLPDKLVKHHFQGFPLPPGTHQYYVRLLSHTHPLPVLIWEASAYERNRIKQQLVYGAYLGFMLFVVLSNLFFFVTLRNRIYLLYVVAVLAYVGYAAVVLDGFILYLLPRLDMMFWYVTIPTIGNIVQLVYCIFFLETSRYVPRFTRLLWVVTGVLVVYAGLKLALPQLPIPLILTINTSHALLSFLLLGLAGYWVGRRGNRLGYYFAIANFIYFALVLTEAVYIQTGSPGYLIGMSHVTLATIIEVVILSFLLSRRFEWERNATEAARAEAQRQLLDKTRENERILQRQNETLEREVAERTHDINQKSIELQQSLDHLTTTQNQLIQREKMASLGELTAGIAHEIQNPLNFVNNFSDLSVEMIGELREGIQQQDYSTVNELTHDLQYNIGSIAKNGKRASGIVRSMLEHSRLSSGTRQPTNLNALADEYLQMAYQGYRLQNQLITVQLITQFDEELELLDLVTQDIARVLLNLYTNAFYAVAQRATMPPTTNDPQPPYEPIVWVSTQKILAGEAMWGVEIRIKDNGTGIPDQVLPKIFQPFFTTKPSGQGTGLGLSLSYDIITKGNGGEMTVNTVVGHFTEFIIRLPAQSSAS